jgi:hypothetical protein
MGYFNSATPWLRFAEGKISGQYYKKISLQPESHGDNLLVTSILFRDNISTPDH